jgi:hypothetical protein
MRCREEDGVKRPRQLLAKRLGDIYPHAQQDTGAMSMQQRQAGKTGRTARSPERHHPRCVVKLAGAVLVLNELRRIHEVAVRQHHRCAHLCMLCVNVACALACAYRPPAHAPRHTHAQWTMHQAHAHTHIRTRTQRKDTRTLARQLGTALDATISHGARVRAARRRPRRDGISSTSPPPDPDDQTSSRVRG